MGLKRRGDSLNTEEISKPVVACFARFYRG